VLLPGGTQAPSASRPIEGRGDRTKGFTPRFYHARPAA
jgi:hypothetical protein